MSLHKQKYTCICSSGCPHQVTHVHLIFSYLSEGSDSGPCPELPTKGFHLEPNFLMQKESNYYIGAVQ